MENRLQVMLAAVQTVRPALDHLYRSLSDEQNARFNAVAPTSDAVAGQDQRNLTTLCDQRTLGMTDLPIDRIAQAVRPTSAQQAVPSRPTCRSSNRRDFTWSSISRRRPCSVFLCRMCASLGPTRCANTPRVHRAHLRRGCRVAACGRRAAAGKRQSVALAFSCLAAPARRAVRGQLDAKRMHFRGSPPSWLDCGCC
jgi:hypothetical protein